MALQKIGGRIEGSEGEGNDPAQQELDEDIVDRHRIAPECDHVVDGRRDAHPVLEPEAQGAEHHEHREIDGHAAGRHQQKQHQVQRGQGQVQLVPHVDDHHQAGGEFLEGLDSKGFEDHLEKGMQRAQHDLIEPSLHDVALAELVEVHAEYVEETQTDQVEPVNEEQFLECPPLEGTHPMKEDVEETEARHRARQAGEHRDQEVSRISQPDLDVLGKVIAQNGEVSHSPVSG